MASELHCCRFQGHAWISWFHWSCWTERKRRTSWRWRYSRASCAYSQDFVCVTMLIRVSGRPPATVCAEVGSKAYPMCIRVVGQRSVLIYWEKNTILDTKATNRCQCGLSLWGGLTWNRCQNVNKQHNLALNLRMGHRQSQNLKWHTRSTKVGITVGRC